MLNIFNLFLFLIVVWLLFMVSYEKLSADYLVLGVFLSLSISLICYHLKIIEKKSEMLYMSLGFYRHFFPLYLKNFIPSICLLFGLAFKSSNQLYESHKILLNSKEKQNNSEIMQATINLMAGSFVDVTTKNFIMVYFVNKKFLTNFNAKSIFRKLENINDDNIV